MLFIISIVKDVARRDACHLWDMIELHGSLLVVLGAHFVRDHLVSLNLCWLFYVALKTHTSQCWWPDCTSLSLRAWFWLWLIHFTFEILLLAVFVWYVIHWLRNSFKSVPSRHLCVFVWLTRSVLLCIAHLMWFKTHGWRFFSTADVAPSTSMS